MLTQARIGTRVALGAAVAVLVSIAFLAGRATMDGGGPPVVPGPLRVVDGVGVGFTHSELGAEGAAAHYLLELERAIDTLDVRRAAAVADLVTTAGGAGMFDARAPAAVALERSDGAPLRRVAISTDPISYSPTVAQVTVLECWIYATATREAVWAIERVSLVWEQGDWRMSAITGAALSANESLGELRSQLEFPGPGDATVR
jgi:hypothetical protein